MNPLQVVTNRQVENYTFSSTCRPPTSTKTHFLAGAGVRGLEIQGKFVKFTAVGVYIEDSVVSALSNKWKEKSAEELSESVELFRDIVTVLFWIMNDSFGVILQVPLRNSLERVSDNDLAINWSTILTEGCLNCMAIWKSLGVYTDDETEAIEQFLEAFKDENFPIDSLSQDESIGESWKVEIDNKKLGESVLESIIGNNGVSPAAKKNLAERFSRLLNDGQEESEADNCAKQFKGLDIDIIQVETGKVSRDRHRFIHNNIYF
ncbi:hypothetical protein Patl1_06228 [Pistacia atlantica]|uniref:Uncharacterized protein n=1 Tax=Pistacia atlantica TaxID=434234 RepID=A0ACC1BRK9_9ROSI|nr:hypothetical protein Patl1_06228 [Pistacia atlantica]